MVLFSFGLSDIEIQAQNTKCMYIVRKKLIKFIQTIETGRKASLRDEFCSLFHSTCK